MEVKKVCICSLSWDRLYQKLCRVLTTSLEDPVGQILVGPCGSSTDSHAVN